MNDFIPSSQTVSSLHSTHGKTLGHVWEQTIRWCLRELNLDVDTTLLRSRRRVSDTETKRKVSPFLQRRGKKKTGVVSVTAVAQF